eukprot:766407-Hanusia_phi.AAC.11
MAVREHAILGSEGDVDGDGTLLVVVVQVLLVYPDRFLLPVRSAMRLVPDVGERKGWPFMPRHRRCSILFHDDRLCCKVVVWRDHAVSWDADVILSVAEGAEALKARR